MFTLGYEIEGLEKLPNEGPAIIILYHGTVPFDLYYFLAECLLKKKRLFRSVADRYCPPSHSSPFFHLHLSWMGFEMSILNCSKFTGIGTWQRIYTCRDWLFLLACRFLFKWLPGLAYTFRLMGATEGSPEECIQLLKEGHVLTIAPGIPRSTLLLFCHMSTLHLLYCFRDITIILRSQAFAPTPTTLFLRAWL